MRCRPWLPLRGSCHPACHSPPDEVSRPLVGVGALDDPLSAQRCHPEEAQPPKDPAPGGSKSSRLLRKTLPGAVGILRFTLRMT